jgi:hypothetical protein
MKSKSYTYKVKKYNRDRNAKIEYTDKEVKAADMFEVNTTIMRCLVKNLAMFGLGISGNSINTIFIASAQLKYE